MAAKIKGATATSYVSKSRKRRKHAKSVKHGNKAKAYRGQGRV
jgi:hypothetical protein